MKLKYEVSAEMKLEREMDLEDIVFESGSEFQLFGASISSAAKMSIRVLFLGLGEGTE